MQLLSDTLDAVVRPRQALADLIDNRQSTDEQCWIFQEQTGHYLRAIKRRIRDLISTLRFFEHGALNQSIESLQYCKSLVERTMEACDDVPTDDVDESEDEDGYVGVKSRCHRLRMLHLETTLKQQLLLGEVLFNDFKQHAVHMLDKWDADRELCESSPTLQYRP